MENVATSKNKKIVNILLKFLIIIVAVIGLSSAILCFIPKTYGINLNDSNITAIKIYKNGSAQSMVYKSLNEEKFNEIYNKYKSTFKTTFMEALIKGKLDSKEEIEYKSQYSVYTNIASSTEKSYLMFDYDEEQTLIYRGKEYDNPDFSGTKIEKFNQVLVEVNNSSKLERFTIYYVDSSLYSYYRVTVLGIQDELYKYISNFES